MKAQTYVLALSIACSGCDDSGTEQGADDAGGKLDSIDSGPDGDESDPQWITSANSDDEFKFRCNVLVDEPSGLNYFEFMAFDPWELGKTVEVQASTTIDDPEVVRAYRTGTFGPIDTVGECTAIETGLECAKGLHGLELNLANIRTEYISGGTWCRSLDVAYDVTLELWGNAYEATCELNSRLVDVADCPEH